MYGTPRTTGVRPRSARSSWLGLSAPEVIWPRSRNCHGEIKDECGTAFPGRGIHKQPPSVCVDELAGDREPEASAVILGGEKRREDLLAVRRRNTRTVVGNFHRREALLNVGANDDCFALRGSLDGIAKDVQQRLFQLELVEWEEDALWAFESDLDA